jgi:hypothetical protein
MKTKLAAVLAVLMLVPLTGCEMNGARSSKSIANEVGPWAVKTCSTHGGVNDVTPIENATDDFVVYCNDNTWHFLDG